MLEERDHSVIDRLHVSSNCPLIPRVHVALDQAREAARVMQKLVLRVGVLARLTKTRPLGGAYALQIPLTRLAFLRRSAN